MNLRRLTKYLVLLAVAAQLLVLAWMAGEREWICRTGRVVHLRAAPIDPRVWGGRPASQAFNANGVVD